MSVTRLEGSRLELGDGGIHDTVLCRHSIIVLANDRTCLAKALVLTALNISK